MTSRKYISRARLGTAFAALAIGLGTVTTSSAASAAPVPGSYKPSHQVLLSVGEGEMINLPRSVANVWTSSPDVADVYVSTAKQINIFGKSFGNATIIATASDGSVVYGASVAVNQNSSSISEQIHQALPDSNITISQLGQMAVLNGTVGSPEDATQAEALVRSMLNAGIKEGEPLKVLTVNRLKTATPLQVTLKVRIAEINRTLLKKVGVNLLSTDTTSGFHFLVGQGQSIDPTTSKVTIPNIGSIFAGRGNFLGLDLIGALELAETDGLATTLAEPSLTALSGETASFLAGGEFPVPISQGLASISVEYKQFGVGLAFTPIVLADGRISMRVRPEVSELSEAGSVKLGGYTIPALTTRRAETTVELGSGQSFMIGGLLQNRNRNNVEKAPFLGDLPILGALFRSTSFQRDETELVIIVTPYLVRPVSRQMAVPTDGYRAPTDVQQMLEGQTFKGTSGVVPPTAISAPTASAGAPSGAAPAPGFRL